MHKQTKPSYIAYGCRYISDIKKKKQGSHYHQNQESSYAEGKRERMWSERDALGYF